MATRIQVRRRKHFGRIRDDCAPFDILRSSTKPPSRGQLRERFRCARPWRTIDRFGDFAPVTVGIHGDAAMMAQGFGQLASIAGEVLYSSRVLACGIIRE